MATPSDQERPLAADVIPIEIICPDLDLGEIDVSLSLWLVEIGHEVTQGDRLIELVGGGVTVDLPAPASGIVLEMRVAEDEPVQPGQVLGLLTPAPENLD